MKQLLSPMPARHWPLVVALFSTISAAQAHPGHPLSASDAAHLLTSPDHALVLAAIGGLMLFAARRAQVSLSRRMLVRGGAAALIGAAAVWTLRA